MTVVVARDFVLQVSARSYLSTGVRQGSQRSLGCIARNGATPRGRSANLNHDKKKHGTWHGQRKWQGRCVCECFRTFALHRVSALLARLSRTHVVLLHKLLSDLASLVNFMLRRAATNGLRRALQDQRQRIARSAQLVARQAREQWNQSG